MDKIAVDNSAKAYWKLLYGEYGEELVRDIPRRIKAALESNKKVAASDNYSVTPFAHAKDAAGMTVEGLYTTDGKKFLFNASLNKDCEIVEISTVEIK